MLHIPIVAGATLRLKSFFVVLSSVFYFSLIVNVSCK